MAEELPAEQTAVSMLRLDAFRAISVDTGSVQGSVGSGWASQGWRPRCSWAGLHSLELQPWMQCQRTVPGLGPPRAPSRPDTACPSCPAVQGQVREPSRPAGCPGSRDSRPHAPGPLLSSALTPQAEASCQTQDNAILKKG